MESLTDETKQRQKLLHSLFVAYGQEKNGERLAVYCEALKEFPVPILRKVCKKIMMEQHFIPAISDIVEAGRSLVGEVDPGHRQKTWGEAWQEIQKQTHDAFLYGKPHWSTPEIEAAVKAFGYKELCCLQADEVRTASAQMRRFYEDACRRSRERQVNAYVLHIDPGLPEGTKGLLEGLDMNRKMLEKKGRNAR